MPSVLGESYRKTRSRSEPAVSSRPPYLPSATTAKPSPGQSPLIPPRPDGTAHQGRQERHQVDPAVMPRVRPQRRPSPAPRARLQSRQLHAHPGVTGCRRTVVTVQPARNAHQDRREVRAPRALRHAPDGRGRYPEGPVLRHPEPHRSAQREHCSGMTVGRPETTGRSRGRCALKVVSSPTSDAARANRPSIPMPSGRRRPSAASGLPIGRDWGTFYLRRSVPHGESQLIRIVFIRTTEDSS